MDDVIAAIKNNTLLLATISYDRWYDHVGDSLGWMYHVNRFNSDGTVNAKKFYDNTPLDSDYFERLKQIKTDDYIITINRTDAAIIRKDVRNYKFKKDANSIGYDLYYKDQLVTNLCDEADWIKAIIIAHK